MQSFRLFKLSDLAATYIANKTPQGHQLEKFVLQLNISIDYLTSDKLFIEYQREHPAARVEVYHNSP